MAKKNQEVEVTSQEQEVVTPVVEPTQEEAALTAALAADDRIGALNNLKDDLELSTEHLRLLIMVYTSLVAALGAESGAAVQALANLETFKSVKVKKVRPPKTPKFNEKAALKDALANDTLAELQAHDQASQALKDAISAHLAIKDSDAPDAVKDIVFANLSTFGKKASTGSRTPSGPIEKFGVELEGVEYPNLSQAIYANYTKDINEKGQRLCDVAWRAVRTKLQKDGTAELDGRVYTKIAA